jgi:hypothetical protein
MRRSRILELAGLGLIATLALGSGCPLSIPDLKDKVIQLAVGGSTTALFHADGSINVSGDKDTVDIASQLDLNTIIRDAGVDPNDVLDIKLSGVSYRVTRLDPEPTRAIANGNVFITRQGGTEQTLVANFSENPVNAVTSYKTAPLDPAGVAVLNGLLHDILLAVQANSSTVPNSQVIYRFFGTSTPTTVTTDFDWEIKVDITVVGKKAL